MAGEDVSLDEILDDLGIAVDVATGGAAIALVADRLTTGGPREEVESAARQAATAVWSDDRAAEVREGLGRLRARYVARLEAIDTAESALASAPEQNAVALALVARAAVELWARARRGYDQIALLEDELTRANPGEHRARALSVAAAAIPVLGARPR